MALVSALEGGRDKDKAEWPSLKVVLAIDVVFNVSEGREGHDLLNYIISLIEVQMYVITCTQHQMFVIYSRQIDSILLLLPVARGQNPSLLPY